MRVHLHGLYGEEYLAVSRQEQLGEGETPIAFTDTAAAERFVRQLLVDPVCSAVLRQFVAARDGIAVTGRLSDSDLARHLGAGLVAARYRIVRRRRRFAGSLSGRTSIERITKEEALRRTGQFPAVKAASSTVTRRAPASRVVLTGSGGRGTPQEATMIAAKRAGVPFTQANCNAKTAPAVTAVATAPPRPVSAPSTPTEGGPRGATPPSGIAGILAQLSEGARKLYEGFLSLFKPKPKAALKVEPAAINDFPAAPDNGKPLRGQTKNDTCALASASMAIEIVSGTKVTEAQLVKDSMARANGYRPGNGTQQESVADSIKALAGTTTAAAYKKPLTPADIQKTMAGGGAVIVSVDNQEWFGNSGGHAVVVTGVRTNRDGSKTYLVNDPWPMNSGKRLEVPADRFEKAMRGWGTVVTKK